MEIKFLEDREVKDGDGKVIQRFKAGQVVELSGASARHWLNREAAEIYMKAKPGPKPKAKPSDPTKSHGSGPAKPLSA